MSDEDMLPPEPPWEMDPSLCQWSVKTGGPDCEKKALRKRIAELERENKRLRGWIEDVAGGEVMKRYTLKIECSGGDLEPGLYESEAGEWVRYEDAQERIAELERENAIAGRQIETLIVEKTALERERDEWRDHGCAWPETCREQRKRIEELELELAERGR